MSPDALPLAEHGRGGTEIKQPTELNYETYEQEIGDSLNNIRCDRGGWLFHDAAESADGRIRAYAYGEGCPTGGDKTAKRRITPVTATGPGATEPGLHRFGRG